MILIDYNGVAIGSGLHLKGELSEDLFRHTILNTLRMYRNKFKGQYGELVICGDGRKNWRREVFPNYKFKRGKSKSASDVDWNELYRIIYLVFDELGENFPYKTVLVEECEADDVIATLSQSTQEFGNNEPIMIVSADKNGEYAMSIKSKLKNSLFFETDRVLISFSNPFMDDMKTAVSKKELLALIDICCREALINDAYKQVKQAPKVILQPMLGDVILIRNYSNLLEKSMGRLKRYASLTERAPPFEVVENWDIFIEYLEKRPLFNNIINPRRFNPIPSIKTEEEYNKAKKYVDALFQKKPNQKVHALRVPFHGIRCAQSL